PVPLQKLHRRWADPAAAGFASALLRLHDTVEAEGRPMEPIQPTVDIALDIEIAGPPAAVFAALTKDVGGWWGHPFVTARATSLALAPPALPPWPWTRSWAGCSPSGGRTAGR